MARHLIQARYGVATALLVVAAMTSSAQAATYDVSVDFTNATAFRGIGSNIWASTKRPTESDSLLKDLNAKLVRVSVTPSAPADQFVSGMSVQQMLAVFNANKTARQDANFTSLRDRMNTLGISIHQIVWASMPPQWLTIDTTRPAGSNAQSIYAKDEHLQDYANYVTAILLYGKNLSIVPAGVELTNEPHGAWGTRYTPTQYASFVNLTRKAMDANGLGSVTIDGPGTGLRNWSDFLPALQQSGAINNLKTITAHVYQTPTDLNNPNEPGVAEFMGHGQYGPIIISEFGSKYGNDVGTPIHDQTTPETALQSASLALNLLRLGAEGMMHWQLETTAFSDKDMGMIDATGLRRPSAFALQTLFGQLPVAGTVTAPGVGVPNDVLPVQAFRGLDGKIYYAVVNRTTEAHTLNIKLVNNTKVKRILTGTIYNGTGLPVVQLTKPATTKLDRGVFTTVVEPGTANFVALQ